MLFIGLISGTSMDAVDTALLDIDDNHIELRAFIEYPIPDPIRTPLRAINEETPVREVSRMDVTLGELFAEAVLELLAQTTTRPTEVTAIGSHGQTVFHSPNSKPPCTLQIADPNIIASRTGIMTIADFRRMDVANGGQGAPFAPLFHQAFFQADFPRVVLNIGGIANITLLSDDPNTPVTGFDTGPGNGLMDDWIQRHKRERFDQDGQWAKSGTVSKDLLEILLADDYFRLPAPKSTGRDDFNLAWLDSKLEQCNQPIAPEDVQATLLKLTVLTISEAITNSGHHPHDILVCGGGASHPLLMQKLGNALSPIVVHSTEASGMDPAAIEAGCFAWLAGLRLGQRRLDLASLTGSHPPVSLGGVYYP